VLAASTGGRRVSLDRTAAPSGPRTGPEDLRLGDHACHPYGDPLEADEVAARVLCAALRRGEAGLWVRRGAARVEEALAAAGVALAATGVDLLAEARRGALEVVPASDFFLANGEYEPQRQLRAYRERTRAALERGFAGLVCVSDATEVAAAAGASHVLEAEAEAGPAFQAPVAVLCQLDRSRVPASLALAVARAHPLVVHAGRLLRNQDAAPPEATLGQEPPGAELNRLLRRALERETEEAVLRDSERLFRLLTHNARDVLFRARLVPSLAFEYVGPAITDMCGHAPEEFYRDPGLAQRMVHPDDRHLVADLPASAVLEGLVLRWVHRDGHVVYTEPRSIVISDQAGVPIAIEGVVRDVSARVRAEEALRENERRLRAVVSALAEGVLFFDAEGRVADCNAAAERLLGWPRERLLGSSRTQSWHALRDDGTPYPASEYPVNRTFESGTPVRGSLIGLIRPDGSLRWLSMSSEPLPADPAGSRGVLVSFADLTTERRAWVEVRRREAQLRLAMECAGHAFWELDVGGGEQRGADPGGRSLESVRWMALVHPEDRERAVAELAAHVEGRTPTYVSEHRLPAPDGTWRWVLTRGRAVSRDENGRATRMAGTITDVTEARRLQERLRNADRLAGVGALAAGVAHEVNNPLAYVSANLAVLDEALARLTSAGPAGPAAAERLDELRQALRDAMDGAARVRDIVRGLRQFAQPSRGEERAPVDVRTEIEAAVGIARNEIAHRARLRVELPERLPAVRAAPHELGQVFVNLLVNAAQAIPEGHAQDQEVRITAREEAGRVLVEVSDTGAGIDQADLARIFDPFFTTKPVGTGTGLGLSVCHGIVTALGGTIEVDSAPGRGTCFRVSLPAQAEPAPAPRPRPAAPAATRRGRVLVIDDEALVGKSLARLLAAHEVTVLTSPREVLRRVGLGERWDLVLCDLMMPEMSGMELEERLAAEAPELVARTIYLTGGAFTERSRAFLAADRPHLEKPVDPASLRALVAERVDAVLSGKR
jgi:PAS domain S-box-containing protein